VTPTRDYEQWHKAYDDPNSGLSWRLATVRAFVATALDRAFGRIADTTTDRVRVLSSCSGDGRDVLGVLAGRPDAGRVDATLVEINPVLARRARRAAAGLPARVEVREADAGTTSAYLGAVPADLVLLVGVFGNIDDADLATTIAAAPTLCAPGATLLWTRGRDRGDHNDVVRRRFADAGFAELDYATVDRGGSKPSVGAVRYDGPPRPCEPGRALFTFVR
jgi:hypothetical protein